MTPSRQDGLHVLRASCGGELHGLGALGGEFFHAFVHLGVDGLWFLLLLFRGSSHHFGHIVNLILWICCHFEV